MNSMGILGQGLVSGSGASAVSSTTSYACMIGLSELRTITSFLSMIAAGTMMQVSDGQFQANAATGWVLRNGTLTSSLVRETLRSSRGYRVCSGGKAASMNYSRIFEVLFIGKTITVKMTKWNQRYACQDAVALEYKITYLGKSSFRSALTAAPRPWPLAPGDPGRFPSASSEVESSWLRCLKGRLTFQYFVIAQADIL
jgi:hypothetical protein